MIDQLKRLSCCEVEVRVPDVGSRCGGLSSRRIRRPEELKSNESKRMEETTELSRNYRPSIQKVTKTVCLVDFKVPSCNRDHPNITHIQHGAALDRSPLSRTAVYIYLVLPVNHCLAGRLLEGRIRNRMCCLFAFCVVSCFELIAER